MLTETVLRKRNHCPPDLPVIVVNDRELRDVSAKTITALHKANTPPRLFVSDQHAGQPQWPLRVNYSILRHPAQRWTSPRSRAAQGSAAEISFTKS